MNPFLLFSLRLQVTLKFQLQTTRNNCISLIGICSLAFQRIMWWNSLLQKEKQFLLIGILVYILGVLFDFSSHSSTSSRNTIKKTSGMFDLLTQDLIQSFHELVVQLRKSTWGGMAMGSRSPAHAALSGIVCLPSDLTGWKDCFFPGAAPMK